MAENITWVFVRGTNHADLMKQETKGGLQHLWFKKSSRWFLVILKSENYGRVVTLNGL